MLEAVFKYKTLNWNDAFFEIDMIENQIKLRWRDFAYTFQVFLELSRNVVGIQTQETLFIHRDYFQKLKKH